MPDLTPQGFDLYPPSQSAPKTPKQRSTKVPPTVRAKSRMAANFGGAFGVGRQHMKTPDVPDTTSVDMELTLVGRGSTFGRGMSVEPGPTQHTLQAEQKSSKSMLGGYQGSSKICVGDKEGGKRGVIKQQRPSVKRVNYEDDWTVRRDLNEANLGECTDANPFPEFQISHVPTQDFSSLSFPQNYQGQAVYGSHGVAHARRNSGYDNSPPIPPCPTVLSPFISNLVPSQLLFSPSPFPVQKVPWHFDISRALPKSFMYEGKGDWEAFCLKFEKFCR